MSGLVRSARLFGPIVSSGGGALIYTVPADRTALLRGLDIVVPGSGTATVSLRINGNTTSNDFVLLSIVAPGGTYLDQWRVLNPGDTVTAVGSLLAVITGYGVLLPGPPV